MTPDVIAAAISIIERIGLLPLGTLFFISQVGPWMLSLALNYSARKQYEALAAENKAQYALQATESKERFERVVAMYESNVILVKSYEKFADGQADVITLNTQAWIEVKKAIEVNEFCPVIRSRRTSHQSTEFDIDPKR